MPRLWNCKLDDSQIISQHPAEGSLVWSDWRIVYEHIISRSKLLPEKFAFLSLPKARLWLPYSLPAWIRRAETTRFSLDCRRFRCKRLCCKWFPYKRFQSSSKSQADLKRRHSSNSEFILLIETNEKLISLSIRLWIRESGSYERLRSVCIFGGEPQWWFVLNWFEFNARFVSDFVSDLNAKL